MAHRSVRTLAVVLAAASQIVLPGCNSKSATGPDDANPTPAPTATPSPTPKPCTAAPGPITSYAILPRLDLTLENDVTQALKVRVVIPFRDEVLCIDKDATHRIEFDSKQKNAARQEACGENDPAWRIVEDPDGIVANAAPFTNN